MVGNTSGTFASLTGSLLFIGLMLELYLMPGIVASVRKHHNAPAIWILNIFAGWTVVGWFGAFMWSFTNR
jgi:hypothetical protein